MNYLNQESNQSILFCKYHPVIEASHFCQSCHICLCDECINVDNYTKINQCYLCNSELDLLEKRNNILPFWRRLQESFRYPMNTNSVILIVGLAILSSVSGFIPGIFAILWSLLLTSALFKYSFSCLNNTSHGDLEAPDVSESFGGGLTLALKLLLMIVVLFGIFWTSLYFLGLMVASIVSIILISMVPAMMISFALSESIIDALNPQIVIRLISSVGLPYGLLLGFVMIMIASVGIINEFIGNDFSMFSMILQSSVSNYYMIVIFHIMGYMIFQYHKELGFDQLNTNSQNSKRKPVFEKNMTHVDILIKEGRVDDAIHIFKETINAYPEERHIKQKYFELLLVTKARYKLKQFASDYLHYLNQENRMDQIPYTLKRIYRVSPKFRPITAEQRHMIASICAEKGDSSLVIKLTKGLHIEFPRYSDLVGAYSLMATALDQLPNMQSHAQACRNLIKRLDKQKH